MTSDWNGGYQNTDDDSSRTQNLIGRIGQMPQLAGSRMLGFPNTGNSQMNYNNPQMFQLSTTPTPAGQLYGYGRHLGRPIRPIATFPTDRFQSTVNRITNNCPVQFSGQLIEYNTTTSTTTPLAIENGSGRSGGGRSINYMTSRQIAGLKKFPSNVKSMILSKVFDGIAVMYSSPTRQNNLRAVIRSPGYLCGCNHCKFKNVVNPHELEVHAGCRQTKHPNDRIYFTNGKTFSDLVYELQKTTTQEDLYRAMKTVSGSNINIVNFDLWKAKHEAAMGGRRVPDN